MPNSRNIPTQSGVDTSPFVQPERFTQLEVKAPAPTKEDMEQMEAPRVTKPLQSVQVNDGSPVLLQATVVGKPRPNVRLFDFDQNNFHIPFFSSVCLAKRWCTIDCIESSPYTI